MQTSEKTIRFPAFLIVNDQGDAITSQIEEGQCFLLYATKELAELYIEQVGGRYVPESVNDDDLRSLCAVAPDIPFFAFNNTARPVGLCLIPTSQFRE